MQRVHELLGRRRGLGEDAEPAVRVLAGVLGQRLRDRGPADTVEAVATGDHVAVQAVLAAVVGVGDVWAVTLEPVHGDVAGLEQQRQPGLEARSDQILDHLRLAVDDDRAPTRQLGEVQVVALAGELQVDAAVHDPLALHARPDPCPDERVDRPLLEHAGADPLLDVVPAPILQHDRVDSRAVQELRERQSRRACADDRNLRTRAGHDESSSASTSAATAKAWLAAGTPQ